MKLRIKRALLNYNRKVKLLLANRLDREEMTLIYKMAYGNDIRDALLKT